MEILVIGKPFFKQGKNRRRLMVEAKCLQCGKHFETRQSSVCKLKSCGCAGGRFKTVHGESHSGGAYESWKSMKQRCTNPKNSKFPRYGGSGITVCERWMSFENFLEDMGHRPEGTTIDRIDNSKGYEPGNCRWATLKQQNRNKSTNTILTIYGKSKCLSEWCEISGVKLTTASARLKRGWDYKSAIFGKLKC